VTRGGTPTGAISVDYATSNGTAVAGTDYTSRSGTLRWAENDATWRTINVPVSNSLPFAGSKSFHLALSNPSPGVLLGSPGSATVSISGSASALEGSLQLGAASYAVAQNAGALTVTANRTGGSSAQSAWATPRPMARPLRAPTSRRPAAYCNGRTETQPPSPSRSPSATRRLYQFENIHGCTYQCRFGRRDRDPEQRDRYHCGLTGRLRWAAHSSVRPRTRFAQNAGKATVAVGRMGGSSGSLSVAYAAKDGSALSGTDFTPTAGTLQWADGDSSAKSVSIPISNATPFSGTKSFAVALSAPSAGGAISSPGTATVAIAGDASMPVGTLMLSTASNSVAQNAGSVTVTVDRTGGSSGAVAVTYGEVNGSAVAGTDYTATSGTLTWAAGDATPKSFSVPISNANPFSGSKSFTIDLSNPTGGAALGTPNTAGVSIAGDAVAAVGAVQLSASGYSVAQSAVSLTVTANRTGGSNGVVSVNYSAANGTAAAGADFTATNGTLTWASGDAASKSFSIPISNATPFSGTKAFSVSSIRSHGWRYPRQSDDLECDHHRKHCRRDGMGLLQWCIQLGWRLVICGQRQLQRYGGRTH